MPTRTALGRWLLNQYQRDFPLVSKPYAAIASEIHVDECTVIETFDHLIADEAISRIGPIIPPNRLGVSLLAAMEVPAEDLERVAAIVNREEGVNHNYEREHRINLWFVVTADHAEALASNLLDLEAKTGYPILRLPLLEAFHIDLGFDLAFDDDLEVAA
jgi:DNA-binding Lrp family transcriptional regulator